VTEPNRGPVALVILDGWGYRPASDHNAACLARTPQLDALRREYPSTLLAASGVDVGLPVGQMGNSEVGHLNLGAGRIVYQDLTRIGKAIADGELAANPVLNAALDRVQASGGRLHLLGLLSDGGIHSHQDHLYALVRLARSRGVEQVCIHAFTDGRDTPPSSGTDFIEQLEAQLAVIGTGCIASVIGRYWAMDRDQRWDRVEAAYQALVLGEGLRHDSAGEAIAAAYAAGETDEFVRPRVICSRDGQPVGPIEDGDGVICFNFRADRAREITEALTAEGFSGFVRRRVPQLAVYVCLTEYDERLSLPVAFPPERLTGLLGEVVAAADLRQLRIAETEKYAHVTFFFNGGEERPFPGEERVLIPSPKEVATYDLRPEMSIEAVTEAFERQIETGGYALAVLNFANPDMVGHTGDLAAAVRAMEAVDTCVGRVVRAVLAAGGRLLITADHGNCEQMADGTGHPHTAHTANFVPCILVDPRRAGVRLRQGGRLADVAPTLLQLLDLPQPPQMTGRSLLEG